MRVKLGSLISTILVIFCVFVSLSYAIDKNSIVGIWLFDEGQGDVVKDSSGNGHDGEIKGDLEWVEGEFDGALSFPGQNDSFVKVPHKDSLNLTTFSFTLWAKLEATGTYQAVLVKTADGSIENYSGYIYEGRKVFWTRFTSGGGGQWGFQKFGTTIVTDNKWHHLAGTYDMESVKSYVDGVVEADAVFDGKPDFSPGPLTIGACKGMTYPVKGVMDDVGLFNGALSKDEINTIMNKGLGEATDVLPVSSKEKLATVWGKIKALP